MSAYPCRGCGQTFTCRESIARTGFGPDLGGSWVDYYLCWDCAPDEELADA